MHMKTHLILSIMIPALFFSSCKKEQGDCPQDVLMDYVDPEGNHVIVGTDGSAYLYSDDGCIYADLIFTPGFLEEHYLLTDSGTFIITAEGPYPVANNFTEDFEQDTFNDLFLFSLDETGKWWNHFTCQSPAFPEVEDYNALRDCIWAGTCEFTDNRLELASDPFEASNQVLQCTAVAPSADMVTSKCSLESQLPFFRCGDDLWYEARYCIWSGMPLTLVDFENSLFLGYPGPRVILRDGVLAFENKFGEKTGYEQATPVPVPVGEWFTLKVHLRFSDQADGQLELWQDGVQLISTSGINIPSWNSIQNSLEVGISATQNDCVLLVDDVRLADAPF